MGFGAVPPVTVAMLEPVGPEPPGTTPELGAPVPSVATAELVVSSLPASPLLLLQLARAEDRAAPSTRTLVLMGSALSKGSMVDWSIEPGSPFTRGELVDDEDVKTNPSSS
jgi:hypothetical protein